MATYRNELPQLSGDFFLMDAGLQSFRHYLRLLTM
jgi:hypothetical protein